MAEEKRQKDSLKSPYETACVRRFKEDFSEDIRYDNAMMLWTEVLVPTNCLYSTTGSITAGNVVMLRNSSEAAVCPHHSDICNKLTFIIIRRMMFTSSCWGRTINAASLLSLGSCYESGTCPEAPPLLPR